MKEKVIFDTNIVRNTETNTCLGGRVELERFLQVADIVIPETVDQEIKRQKRKSLRANKDKFISNPLHRMIGLNEDDTKAFDVDNYIQKLIEGETIAFEVIDLKNNDVLPQIKELALNKKAPFEKGDNTDKGFKDALIYFSVLEYLQEIPNKNVFVCAKDGRLKEALDSHQNIIVVESYEEFRQKSVSQFFDEYFIIKLNDSLSILDVTVTKDNLIEYWDNVNDNKVLLIKVNDDEYVAEVESNEIITITHVAEYRSTIEDLINTTSFENTHKQIALLFNFTEYLSEEEINRILDAAHTNEQIRWIIDDEDVKQFIGILYENTDLIYNPETLQFLIQEFD